MINVLAGGGQLSRPAPGSLFQTHYNCYSRYSKLQPNSLQLLQLLQPLQQAHYQPPLPVPPPLPPPLASPSLSSRDACPPPTPTHPAMMLTAPALPTRPLHLHLPPPLRPLIPHPPCHNADRTCPPHPHPFPAVMLYHNKQYDEAKLHLLQFKELFAVLDEEAKNADPEILEQSHLLTQLLHM